MQCIMTQRTGPATSSVLDACRTRHMQDQQCAEMYRISSALTHTGRLLKEEQIHKPCMHVTDLTRRTVNKLLQCDVSHTHIHTHTHAHTHARTHTHTAHDTRCLHV